MTRDFDLDEVKDYPGSEKGPHPDDDPRAYTKWFLENQPKNAFEGYLGPDNKHNFSEFGLKEKTKDITREIKQPNVTQTINGYYAEDDTNYLKWDSENAFHESVFD